MFARLMKFSIKTYSKQQGEGSGGGGAFMGFLALTGGIGTLGGMGIGMKVGVDEILSERKGQGSYEYHHIVDDMATIVVTTLAGGALGMVVGLTSPVSVPIGTMIYWKCKEKPQ